MSDLSRRQTILDELEFEPGVDAAHIGVAVEDGIVTLTGHVKSYTEKLLAEEAARRIKGVRGIAQEITVRRANDKKGADDQIAQRALRILTWSAAVPDDAFQVKVDNGWMTLRGMVDWRFQKDAAEEAVRHLSSIVGLTNLIVVRPHASTDDIRKRIEDHLRRNARAQGISVGVTDGKVVLSGSVGSWTERKIAETAAWAVPGVTGVDDQLTIA